MGCSLPLGRFQLSKEELWLLLVAMTIVGRQQRSILGGFLFLDQDFFFLFGLCFPFLFHFFLFYPFLPFETSLMTQKSTSFSSSLFGFLCFRFGFLYFFLSPQFLLPFQHIGISLNLVFPQSLSKFTLLLSCQAPLFIRRKASHETFLGGTILFVDFTYAFFFLSLQISICPSTSIPLCSINFDFSLQDFF